MKKIVLLFINILCFNLLVLSQPIQKGDLLFVGLPFDYASDDDMSGAISKATGNKEEINYIHVAILDVDNDGKIWIIDATIKHGVDRHPLDTFLADFTLHDGSLPQLDIMRLKNNKNVANYVEKSLQYIGKQYDVYFLPDNDLYYCSELVRDSYVRSNGKYIFSANPMNFKSEDGTYPAYWVKLFEKIGQEIPQGVNGTNPNAMSKEKCLKKVGGISMENGIIFFN